MPRIGAGYGGRSWKKVRQIIEDVFGGWRGNLHVYEEYAPEEGGGARVPAIIVESRQRKRPSTSAISGHYQLLACSHFVKATKQKLG